MTPPAIEPGAPDPALADPMLRVLREQHPESEGLNGPRKNLAQADPALLGDAVQGAADAFLTTWEQRVLALRDRASGHSDSLAHARAGGGPVTHDRRSRLAAA